MRGIVVAAVVALTAAGEEAQAHHFPHPKRLGVTVEGRHVTLTVSFRLDPGAESLRARAAFDRDTDGHLDEGERSGLQAFLLDRSTRGLSLAIDGAPTRLKPANIALLHAERPTDDGRALELVVRYRIPAGDRNMLLVTVRDRPSRGSRIPIDFDVGPGWSLVRAGPVHAEAGVITAERPFVVSVRRRRAPPARIGKPP